MKAFTCSTFDEADGFCIGKLHRGARWYLCPAPLQGNGRIHRWQSGSPRGNVRLWHWHFLGFQELICRTSGGGCGLYRVRVIKHWVNRESCAYSSWECWLQVGKNFCISKTYPSQVRKSLGNVQSGFIQGISLMNLQSQCSLFWKVMISSGGTGGLERLIDYRSSEMV